MQLAPRIARGTLSEMPSRGSPQRRAVSRDYCDLAQLDNLQQGGFENLQDVDGALQPTSPLSVGAILASKREISIESDTILDTEPRRLKAKEFIESIYGSAMAATAGGMSRGMVVLVYGYLIANIFFQGYLLYAMHNYICAPAIAQIRAIYIDFEERTRSPEDNSFSWALWNDWDEEEKSTLCQVPLSQPVLFVVLLSIWSSCVLIDFRETFTYFIIWWRLPHPEDIGIPGAVTVKHDQDGGLVIECASRMVKFRIFSLVLVPKAIIALILWWLGARWLTATPSFENLVLNAVALAFITDLDEIIYRALAADEVKSATTCSYLKVPPPPQVNSTEPSWAFHGCRAMVGWTLANVLLPLCYLLYFQTVIPNYQWDLPRPCTVWLNALNND